MARINTKPVPVHTHGGAIASHVSPEQQLRRAVMACMLWEDQFYEDGVSIAQRITELIVTVKPETVAGIAIEAREQMNLRHVPLLLVRQMAQMPTHKHVVASTLERIIQRADELFELLAIYWKDGRQPLSAQVKKGLASAFQKFGEYALQKYNRDGAVTLRDVLFLCHAKPKDAEQDALWKRLIAGELATPDTWEVALSAGRDKQATWERLIREERLGGLAFLRNLRNMRDAGVSDAIVFDGLSHMKTERILPFRFLAAAKHAPQWEPQIESAMLRCLEGKEKLRGKTILIVDVSGSMYGQKLSTKSELDRAEGACALAVCVRELCEQPVIYATAGNDHTRIHSTKMVPPRRGLALKDVIYGLCHPLGGGGIFLRQVMEYVEKQERTADRIIVITDEQDCAVDAQDSPEKANAFGTHNYIINVASYAHGISYSRFTHINGWSDAVLDYIRVAESCRQ